MKSVGKLALAAAVGAAGVMADPRAESYRLRPLVNRTSRFCVITCPLPASPGGTSVEHAGILDLQSPEAFGDILECDVYHFGTGVEENSVPTTLVHVQLAVGVSASNISPEVYDVIHIETFGDFIIQHQLRFPEDAAKTLDELRTPEDFLFWDYLVYTRKFDNVFMSGFSKMGRLECLSFPNMFDSPMMKLYAGFNNGVMKKRPTGTVTNTMQKHTTANTLFLKC